MDRHGEVQIPGEYRSSFISKQGIQVRSSDEFHIQVIYSPSCTLPKCRQIFLVVCCRNEVSATLERCINDLNPTSGKQSWVSNSKRPYGNGPKTTRDRSYTCTNKKFR